MNKKNKSTLVLVISVIVLSLVVFGLTISKTRILSNAKLFNFSFSNNKKLKGDVSNPSSNNNLTSITLYNYTVTSSTVLTSFNNPSTNTLEYTINADSNVQNITFDAVKEDSNARYFLYKINGEDVTDAEIIRIKPGITTFIIRVEAESGATQDYTITINKLYADSNKLSRLSVSGSELYDNDNNPTTFDPNVNTYRATIEEDDEGDEQHVVSDYSPYIYAIPELYGASVTIEPPAQRIFGENIYTIRVRGVELPENVYYLKLTVNRAKSDNAELNDIIINEHPINDYGVEFDSTEMHYDITLPDDADCNIQIGYEAKTGQTVTVTPASIYTCKSPLMEYDITVVSEDGENTNVYEIFISRNIIVSTKLSSLSVVNGDDEQTEYNLTPDFNSDTTSYAVTVPYDVDNISIKATTVDSDVSVEMHWTDNREENTLNIGDNVLEITCSAASVTDTKYTLTITREGPSLNKLSGLAINGYSISPNFNPDINNYTATVPYEVESIFVVAENNTQIPLTITGDGNHDLIVGQNTINIDVTPPGGTANRYTIQVTRLDNVEFDDLDIDNGIAVINEPMNVSQIKEKAGVSYNPIILDEDKNEKEDTSKVKTGDFLRIGGHDYPISLLGDYYKDGNVNLFDINALYTDYVEGTIPTDDEAKLKAGDYYKDNSVNLFDVQALYEWYLGL